MIDLGDAMSTIQWSAKYIIVYRQIVREAGRKKVKIQTKTSTREGCLISTTS